MIRQYGEDRLHAGNWQRMLLAGIWNQKVAAAKALLCIQCFVTMHSAYARQG